MNGANLLLADFHRIKRNKALLVSLIIGLGYALLTVGVMSLLSFLPAGGGRNPVIGKMAMLSVLDSGAFVFIAAVGICIFTGGEFAYNTIRNKIVAGNTRIKIYLSQLATNLIVFFVMFAAVMLFTLVLTVALLGLEDFADIFTRIGLALPLYACMVAIMTFLCMSTKSMPIGIVLNLLLLMVVPSILGMILLLSQNDTLVAVLESNPYSMLSVVLGTDLSEFIGGLIGQGGGALAPNVILKSLLVSVIYGGAFTGLGLTLFYYADIK